MVPVSGFEISPEKDVVLEWAEGVTWDNDHYYTSLSEESLLSFTIKADL